MVNNSWGSSNPADDTFRPAVQALRAAGIAPVFAAGNPDAGPGSIGSPASVPEAIAVGATDIDDYVAYFSGRGPSFYPGEQKPELAAPGVDVNSTLPGGGYSGPTWSGTSMAAPHVAGLVALMVSADLQDGISDLNVAELEYFMAYSALDLGPTGPDDDYGWGRIDALRAVRWALDSGDLRGVVRDATTGQRIAGAVMQGIKTNPADTFRTLTSATGQYSVTVPAGSYDITINAWGYNSATFSKQIVITDTISLKDFNLSPLSRALLSGQVLEGSTPIAGAKIYVADHLEQGFVTTGVNGNYSISLPLGSHELVVEATGYRIQRETVTVAAGGSTHNFDMTSAPTILVVEADAYFGWFFGRPAHNFFQQSLDQKNYLYDTFSLTDLSQLPTLADYDVVIWIHTTGSPSLGGFEPLLSSYLDVGGRLIISGQDIGYYDTGSNFFENYLHANFLADMAAFPGESISGQDFLSGLSLTFNESALYSYPNSATWLFPDAVDARDGHAYPVMLYDNRAGAAVLAVDPCDQPYRAVYFAAGYETLGPRGDNPAPDYAEVLDRSIQWVAGAAGGRPAYEFSLSIDPGQQAGEPGTSVTFDIIIANTGNNTDTYTLSLANTWPTRLLDGGSPVSQIGPLASCERRALTLEVDVPTTARAGEADTAILTTTSQASPDLSISASATTAAFPAWQLETGMPTARYRLGAAVLPGDTYYYAIGGWEVWDASAANERYNACTNEWDVLTPMPQALANVGVTALNGQIYVVGGMDSYLFHYGTVYAYDPTADTWSAVADLPEPLAGAAVTAANGKIYVFGGDSATGFVATTYEYDPAGNIWAEKSPLPGGGRAYAVAATVDDLIYVVGGWPNLRTVELYNPASDTWSTAAGLHIGRQSPGLAVADDGYLYISGGGDGWYGLDSAERYDPAADEWLMLPSLNDGQRAGSASAYAAGRVYAVGGTDWNLTAANESLRITDAFCLSNKQAEPATVQPGDQISYTIELQSDSVSHPSASVVDPIPAGTTFAGFGFNPISATYDNGQNQVEWSGSLVESQVPISFTFKVDVDSPGWTFGDVITNTATFDNGAGFVFSRSAYTILDFADFSHSTKTVDKTMAAAGEMLTYTVHIGNPSTISSTVTLIDPIPANTSYLPGSLTYTLGLGSYAVGTNTINWIATLPTSTDAYVNISGDYEWGDSDGNGVVPGVTFDWIDASGGPVAIDWYTDDGYVGPFDIGFNFNYYGADHIQFFVNSNGSVQFDGGSYWYDFCPLDFESPNDAIHLLGGDRVVDGSLGRVYYQTFGAAPNRYTVIEFYQLRNYGGFGYSNLEAILYENGAIKLQYEAMDPSMTSGVIGLDDSTGTQTVEYLNACPATVHDNLAVLFLPPCATFTTEVHEADIIFGVIFDSPLAPNTWITNTALIDGDGNTFERQAGTLANAVDLSYSSKMADRTEAAQGDTVWYAFELRNDGLLATNASLIDSLPAEVAFVAGSLSCDGGATCNESNGVVAWSDALSPGEVRNLIFAVEVTANLPDLTPIVNQATLTDDVGGDYLLEAIFNFRKGDLGNSFKTVSPTNAAPGEVVTYTVYVRNSGPVDATATLTDTIPVELSYVDGSVECGVGSCSESNGAITWNGKVPGNSMVPIRFQAQVNPSVPDNTVITNEAQVTHVGEADYVVAVDLTIVGVAAEPPSNLIYLPLIVKAGL